MPVFDRPGPNDAALYRILVDIERHLRDHVGGIEGCVSDRYLLMNLQHELYLHFLTGDWYRIGPNGCQPIRDTVCDQQEHGGSLTSSRRGDEKPCKTPYLVP